MLKATVSGSFHRHMSAIYGSVNELRASGVDVLSPSDPRVVDYLGDFLFVASDKLRSIKLVQDRHFEAIRSSDFLWVVCPDGYTGPSTSAEIGGAYIAGTPVFSDRLPLDATLQHYVRKVLSIQSAIEVVQATRTVRSTPNHFLIDPDYAINASHASLDKLHALLQRPSSSALDVERERSETGCLVHSALGYLR